VSVKCILFDWDGTLQRNFTVRYYGYVILGMFTRGWLKQFIFEFLELIESFFARPRLVISEFELWKLKKKHRVGIVTNRSKMFIETMLRRAKIKSGFFDIIGATRGLWNTWGDLSCGWVLIDPKPALFLSKLHFIAFLKKHRLDTSEVLFIGDDASDYLSVVGTGVCFAGIALDESRRKKFLEAGLSDEFIFPSLQSALRDLVLI